MSNFISAINANSGIQTEMASATQKKPTDTLGQEQFLKLFVTQLQNQDPMNPQDATQMTSQLAQYSSLEQLTNLNNSMTALVEATQSSDKFSALNTIGKEVAYKSSAINFEGKPINIGYQLNHAATDVTITIKKNGATVDTISAEALGKGEHYLSWDGKIANGAIATSGEYTFSVQATDSDGQARQIPSLVKSEVTGVDLSGNRGGTLKTKSGEVSFNSILGVFEATRPQESDPS